MILGEAKWIWLKKEPAVNEFAEFFEEFEYEGGSVVLRLCAETDYVVYLNGAYLCNGQFAGYPKEKSRLSIKYRTQPSSICSPYATFKSVSLGHRAVRYR